MENKYSSLRANYMEKENNKYYTPSIEEFYIGFEYEYYMAYDEDSGDDELKELDEKYWESKIVEDTFDISWIENIVLKLENEREVRVKYLDKDDIKSLGFAHIDNDRFIGSTKNYFTYITMTQFSYGSVLKIEASVRKESEKTLVVHSILIKNKSELKVLLKQLGIHE